MTKSFMPPAIAEKITRKTPVSVKEVLERNEQLATPETFWSASPGFVVNNKTGEFFSMSLLEKNVSQSEWNQSLLSLLTNISNLIHRKNLRGGAEIVVIPPTLESIVKSLVPFRKTTPTFDIQFDENTKYIGELVKFDVYVSQDLPEEKILVARIGDGMDVSVRPSKTTPQIPILDLAVTDNPLKFRGEITYWTYINVLNLEDK